VHCRCIGLGTVRPSEGQPRTVENTREPKAFGTVEIGSKEQSNCISGPMTEIPGGHRVFYRADRRPFSALAASSSSRRMPTARSLRYMRLEKYDVHTRCVQRVLP
jgi:hypothetical protein